MADDSDTRLTHHLVFPMRDTHHAPIIFFDGAPLPGAQTESSADTQCQLLGDSTRR